MLGLGEFGFRVYGFRALGFRVFYGLGIYIAMIRKAFCSIDQLNSLRRTQSAAVFCRRLNLEYVLLY